jgi:hypothetical protein
MFLLNRTTFIAAMLLALLCVSPISFGQKGAAGPG